MSTSTTASSRGSARRRSPDFTFTARPDSASHPNFPSLVFRLSCPSVNGAAAQGLCLEGQVHRGSVAPGPFGGELWHITRDRSGPRSADLWALWFAGVVAHFGARIEGTEGICWLAWGDDDRPDVAPVRRRLAAAGLLATAPNPAQDDVVLLRPRLGLSREEACAAVRSGRPIPRPQPVVAAGDQADFLAAHFTTLGPPPGGAGLRSYTLQQMLEDPSVGDTELALAMLQGALSDGSVTWSAMDAEANRCDSPAAGWWTARRRASVLGATRPRTVPDVWDWMMNVSSGLPINRKAAVLIDMPAALRGEVFRYVLERTLPGLGAKATSEEWEFLFGGHYDDFLAHVPDAAWANASPEVLVQCLASPARALRERALMALQHQGLAPTGAPAATSRQGTAPCPRVGTP